jgi:hypothetical protein
MPTMKLSLWSLKSEVYQASSELTTSSALARIDLHFWTILGGELVIVTQHDDNRRSDANLSETTLKPSTVKVATFGKLFELPVIGSVYAQPLLVPNVLIRNQHGNGRYVATGHNQVTAFDADGRQVRSGRYALLRPFSCQTRKLVMGATAISHSQISSSHFGSRINLRTSSAANLATENTHAQLLDELLR